MAASRMVCKSDEESLVIFQARLHRAVRGEAIWERCSDPRFVIGAGIDDPGVAADSWNPPACYRKPTLRVYRYK